VRAGLSALPATSAGHVVVERRGRWFCWSFITL
jgi:hypothetical protein